MSELFRNITTIDDLKIEFQRLLKTLQAHIHDDFYPRNVLGDILHFNQWKTVTFGFPIGDATPFIEMKNGQFNFVISERGHESKRISGNAEDMLERIFEGITFTLAGQFELQHRIEGQDSRRIMFTKQIELLNFLNPGWATNKSIKHETILLQYPFDDDASIRAQPERC